MAGSPPHLDLFDYKPELVRRNGQDCPQEFLRGRRFAFTSGTPKLLGTPQRFRQHGRSGAWASEAVPHIASIADELARIVADRLRGGYIREPHVAIEVEAYRPFFILGEVTVPGQYAYVPHMTAENAIAIAGGFTPRAYRSDIKLDRPAKGGVVRNTVPLLTRIRPGDTIIVNERWF